MVTKNKLALLKIRGLYIMLRLGVSTQRSSQREGRRGRDSKGRKRVSPMRFSSPVDDLVCIPSIVDQRNVLVMGQNLLGFADEDFGYGCLLARKLL